MTAAGFSPAAPDPRHGPGSSANRLAIDSTSSMSTGSSAASICVPLFARNPNEISGGSGRSNSIPVFHANAVRAMRENHGFTVPARWLADLDAIPDGDTGEPQSGYLVGVDTPTAQEAALLQKLAKEFGDAPATTNPEDIVRQRREQQAD